jgi:HAE1 family hydrophobic/amphiphilic exporter-1
LLRNFGSDVNHAQITINRMNQKISLLDFRKAVEQNAADIEQAYWQLVQAVRDVEIQQWLVDQNIANYNVLNTRMRQRLDVSQLQVSQAQTELESARGQLLQFKSQARDLSDKLKGLMSDPEFPIAATTMILPADRPVEDPLNFDLQDQIDTAMENRYELGEEQLKVDEATVTISVARNNLLPQFDFIGSIGPEGAAANAGPAIQTAANLNHFDFSAGFKLQIPIGNREARGIWKRTVLQRMEEIEKYRGLVESISVEIKTDIRAVGTTWNLIRASRRARFAAEDALNAINARERANEPLTPEFVQLKLDTQDRLASALQAEAEAVSNYNIALAQLERAKGTLLRYNNVLLEEDKARLAENGLLR